MAQKILIMGESGTGKTTSLRNLDPAKTAVVNPVGKALPFRTKFETLDEVVDCDQITAWMKKKVKEGKKILIVDDFQYILSIPFMYRIQEQNWDKWNDFGANYFICLDVCKELPDDVTVYYLTHCETLDNGITTVKLIGKLLREKITIEGLFTTVLETCVKDGKYYFLTQNSGKNTVKSPMGMFDSYAIDNDLNYVDEKVRNFYSFSGAKTDEEMKKADETAARPEIQKSSSERKSRRKSTTDTEKITSEEKSENKIDKLVEDEQTEPEAVTDTPRRRTRRVRE